MVKRWMSERFFNLVHKNQLIYNTCWEDPRIDREALELGQDDVIVMITSAGCNALDYVLKDVKAVHAVDMNPRQNALLELKIAAIRHLSNDDVFSMFGRGYMADFDAAYQDAMRDDLSEFSRKYWDRHKRFFSSPKRSFYFRGFFGRIRVDDESIHRSRGSGPKVCRRDAGSRIARPAAGAFRK